MQSASISVIIASYERHQQVVRAVLSALEQTLSPLEVIVVNDGPDSIKSDLLARLNDNRVKFIETRHRGNASATRNVGIREARGEWIALLDDDDAWRSGKLEHQFRHLAESGLQKAILGSVEEVHYEGNRSRLRPRGNFVKCKKVDHLLFCGFGGLHTSTIVAPRHSFIEFPFNEESERHEDWEWLLHAAQKLPILVSPDVDCDSWAMNGNGLSRRGGFDYSKEWYFRNRHLMGSHARAAMVASILSSKAAHDHQWAALPWLVWELMGLGPSHFRRLPRLIGSWLITPHMRASLRKHAGNFVSR